MAARAPKRRGKVRNLCIPHLHLLHKRWSLKEFRLHYHTEFEISIKLMSIHFFVGDMLQGGGVEENGAEEAMVEESGEEGVEEAMVDFKDIFVFCCI